MPSSILTIPVDLCKPFAMSNNDESALHGRHILRFFARDYAKSRHDQNGWIAAKNPIVFCAGAFTMNFIDWSKSAPS